MTAKLLKSPWRTKFESLISSAKTELRIAAPFYSEETIRHILKATEGIRKYFLLALSDKAVMAGAQSTAAIRLMLGDSSCMVRFIKDLHAKFIIADRKHGVVTSSNLTNMGLDSNVELGMLTDDSQTNAELAQHFDGLWSQGITISEENLTEYKKLPKSSPKEKRGKRFGGLVRFGELPENPMPAGAPVPGWILIHSTKDYGVGDKYRFGSPQEELAECYKDGIKWHWTLPRPLKVGGPYTLLLAYEKKVFGQAEADVTRDIDDEEGPTYNFAFVLKNYRPLKKEISFDELPLGHRGRWHRSLIKLDSNIKEALDRLS